MALKPHRTDKTVFSGIFRFAAQFLFDAQQLIIFFNPFAPAGCAGLQMSGVQGHRHIGDKAVDGLPAAMGNTGTPIGLPTHLNRLDGFRQRLSAIRSFNLISSSSLLDRSASFIGIEVR